MTSEAAAPFLERSAAAGEEIIKRIILMFEKESTSPELYTTFQNIDYNQEKSK